MAKNNIIDKARLGGTQDNGLGAKTIADGLTFEIRIIPKPVEGKPLSSAELNKLRIGDGLGQSPSVSYGLDKPSKRKSSKKKDAA